MKKMTKLLVAAIVTMSLMLAIPAFAADLHLGGGYPLFGTHTKDSDTHFDGGYLIYGAVDREHNKWLSFGLMYNYTNIKMGIEETKTEWKYDKYECPRGYECPAEGNDYLPIRAWPETTTTTSHTNLDVHVFGPYAKPFYKLTDRVKLFGMAGGGLMYVDGPVYGDELGAAGFASAGVTFDIYKNFGASAQMLYVHGFTDNVQDVRYYAPVVSLKFEF